MDPLDLLGLMAVAALGYALGRGRRLSALWPLRLLQDLIASRQGTSGLLLAGAGCASFLFVYALMVRASHPYDTDTSNVLAASYLGFAVLAAGWVYRDARERGGRAAAWALMVLATNLLGFVAYLISRPERPRTCPRCGYRMRDEFIVCPYCGPQAGRTCADCEALLEPDWLYCPYCQTPATPPGVPRSSSSGGGFTPGGTPTGSTL